MAKNKAFLLSLIILITTGITALGFFVVNTPVDENIKTGTVAGRIITEQNTFGNIYPGDTVSHRVGIKNEGTLPILVRAKLDKAWKDSNLSSDNILINYNNDKWLNGNDGYFYYKGILNPNRQTDQALCESFTLVSSTGNEYRNKVVEISANFECLQALGNAVNEVWGRNYSDFGITAPEKENPLGTAKVSFVSFDTDFTVDSDLFDGFKNLVPGEAIIKAIEINNKSVGLEKPVQIFLSAENLLQDPTVTELLQNTSITLKSKAGEVLFEGVLSDSKENISLGIFDEGETKSFDVELKVDKNAGNLLQGITADIRWVFSAREKMYDLVVEPGSMVDYMFGDSESRDTFPAVVLKSISGFAGNDTGNTEITVNGQTTTIESYISSLFAFYLVDEHGNVSPTPTSGTADDPEIAGEYRIKAKPNAKLEIGKYNIILGEATLFTKHLSESYTYALAQRKLPKEPVKVPTAYIPPEAQLINSASAPVKDTSGIALISDNLSTESFAQHEELITSIENKLTAIGIEKNNYEALRLSLVNTLNGNIYVTTDSKNYITVTLPYQEGLNPEKFDFVVLHYPFKLDLDKGIDYDITNPEVILPEKTSMGLQFQVNNFSPFAIGRKTANADGGHDNMDGGNTSNGNSDSSTGRENTGRPSNPAKTDVTTETQLHKKYMIGYPDHTFKPDANISRAEVAVMFSNFSEKDGTVSKSNFTDVKENSRYSNGIANAKKLGIITGYPDGTFKPSRPITRAEFATIVSKYKKLNETSENSIPDVSSKHWAKNYINNVAKHGWIEGYPDGTYKPERNISRAEVVTVINNILERKADIDFIKSNNSKLNLFKDLTMNHWAFFHIIEATQDHRFVYKNHNEIWLK